MNGHIVRTDSDRRMSAAINETRAKFAQIEAENADLRRLVERQARLIDSYLRARVS